MNKLPPLSLYIHIPWCIKKCPYCDFNSYAKNSTYNEDLYIERLIFDLKQDLKYVQSRKIHSIFIGGGTPSLFSAKSYENLFLELKKYLNISDNIEITMEANPGTLEYKDFSGYKQVGINRISIGAQSFNENHLKKLGRIHSSNNIHTAVKKIKDAGINNFNIDIMYGLPEQSVDEAIDDINEAIKLEPTHISWYNLTIEPNTYFHKFRPILPNDEKIQAIQEAGLNALAQNGFQRYEVSAFSKPNCKSNHNLNYWQFGDYLGIGAGAHGKITMEDGSIFRMQKTRNPVDYMNADKQPCCNKKQVLQKDITFEFMLNTLRLEDGIAIEKFESRTGLKKSNLMPKLSQAIDKGLINISNNIIQPTNLGKTFLNDLCEIFLP